MGPIYSPCDRERGQYKTLQKAKPSAGVSFIKILGKCPRVLPKPEAEPVTERIPAKHRDEGEDDESDNEYDFAQGRPEFAFSVPLDGEDID